MTQDRIIELAREAGVSIRSHYDETGSTPLELERFAALVRNAALAEQPAQRKLLTDEFLRKLHHIDEFGLFCDYDDFEQIARAIEAAHGIKENA